MACDTGKLTFVQVTQKIRKVVSVMTCPHSISLLLFKIERDESYSIVDYHVYSNEYRITTDYLFSI
jgi:hypothetical protein